MRPSTYSSAILERARHGKLHPMGETFFFDRTALQDLAAEHQQAFRFAQPFPHVVIDNFLSEPLLDALVDELPHPNGDRNWHSFRTPQDLKLSLNSDWQFGPTARQVLNQLNTAPFIDFLVSLTGIGGLIPDPYYEGGGLHQIEAGGFLKIHVDFSQHQRFQLDRRLNGILYLNRDWCPEWGGSLELWDGDMQAPVKAIEPIFNRFVVFVTTDRSFHGHPEPLACPQGTLRRSLAVYYYTNGRPEGEDEGTYGTTFRARPGEVLERRTGSTRNSARNIAKGLVPPILVPGLKKAQQWLHHGR